MCLNKQFRKKGYASVKRIPLQYYNELVVATPNSLQAVNEVKRGAIKYMKFVQIMHMGAETFVSVCFDILELFSIEH